MRDVTTAYHNANKADIRSSDFLIVSDTGFSLNMTSGSSGWVKKSSIDQSIGMYRCSKETSENVTDYGYIEFEYYYNAITKYFPEIFIYFEDCVPTFYRVEIYTSANAYKGSGSYNNKSSNAAGLLADTFLQIVGTRSDTYTIRFRFEKWSKQGVKPVILFTTYGQPAVFTKDDLLSVNITLETDPTAQSIPYNSYECTIIDETDAYNPLLKDSKIYNFTPGQKFKFFNFEKGFNADDDEIITDNISLFDHEICPVGTAYFRDAKQQGTAVTFDFVDIVEKYDNIPLSDEELELSSHFIKRNIKEYLTTLFGADLDTSSVPATLEAITPFYTESKTQILLYMAQLIQKYIYVTTEGIFSFREQSNFSASAPFCIELSQSYQNPVIEKNYENNGVEVNMYAYSLSRNPELAFNRMEFLYDGEVKAYSDGNTIFDPETHEQIFEIPKYDFEKFSVRYILNDIYEKDSLFVAPFNGTEKSIAEIQNIINTPSGKFDVITLEDGSQIVTQYNLFYYDTHIIFEFIPSEKIDANHNYYDKILVYGLSNIIIMDNLQGCPITSATNSVKRKKYTSDDSGPAVTIDNPLITDFETAKTVRDWMYTQINNSAFSIETDWRGDCSIELGDDVTAEVAITQNGVRDYESRYIGTVVKNVIEYNGALKMQTTLFAPTQERWS